MTTDGTPFMLFHKLINTLCMTLLESQSQITVCISFLQSIAPAALNPLFPRTATSAPAILEMLIVMLQETLARTVEMLLYHATRFSISDALTVMCRTVRAHYVVIALTALLTTIY